MSGSVGSNMRQAAADGYFGTRDFKTSVTPAQADGRGLTRQERSRVINAMSDR